MATIATSFEVGRLLASATNIKHKAEGWTPPRHAEDLDLALRALAGPDLLQRTAWRVALPPPRHRRLGEFRVAVWGSSPLCRIDSSVSDLFDRAINAIVRAGATVNDAARPGIDDEEHHRLFMRCVADAGGGDCRFPAQPQPQSR